VIHVDQVEAIVTGRFGLGQVLAEVQGMGRGVEFVGAWSHCGELPCYVEGGDTLMAVAVSAAGEFDRPSRVFQYPDLADSSGYPRYDISSDGRFLVVEPVGGESAEPSIRFTSGS